MQQSVRQLCCSHTFHCTVEPVTANIISLRIMLKNFPVYNSV